MSDEEPGRISPKPRVYNDQELQTIRSEAEMHQEQKEQHGQSALLVTITTQTPNTLPQHQVIYPPPRIPDYSRTIPQSGSIASGDGTYSSAQTLKTGTKNSTKSETKTLPKQESSIATSAVSDLINEGVQYYQDGNYTYAMKSFKSVLKSEAIRRSQGKDPLVAKMLANMGSIYLRQNLLDHAIESLDKAVRMMQRSTIQYETINSGQQLIPANTAMAWVLNNLGTAKFLKGDYKGSLDCHWQAIKDAKKHDGEPNKKDMANAVFNIGRIAILQKDYVLALSSLRNSLLLETQLYGAKSKESIDTLNMIGFAYYSTKKYKQAMSIFKEALSIITTNFGAIHEKVAESLVNVGMVFERERDLQEALRCFSTARTVCEKSGLDERNKTMQTVIRSVNEVEEKLTIRSVGHSKLKSLVRQSYAARGIPPRTEQRDEMHSDGMMDAQVHTASHQQSRNAPPMESRIPSRHQNSHPNVTVRTDAQKVKSYLVYKEPLSTGSSTDEYREDPYWQYDDSSVVEDGRD